MQIFLRCIPEDIRPDHIHLFFSPFLKKRFISLFNKSGQILDIRICDQKDKQFKAVARHAIVTIEPDSIGHHVLKKSFKQPLKGKRIIIREFAHRSWHNDRRLRRENIWHIKNRRMHERRQHSLQTASDFGVSIRGLSQFSRKSL